MITQRLGSQGTPMEYWQFTVNTEGGGSGAKTFSTPFNLYDQSSDCSVTIDWGDGYRSTHTPTSNPGFSRTSGIRRVYQSAGVYTVTIGFRNNEKMYFNYYGSADYTCNPMIVSINTPLPTIKGVRRYSNNAWENYDDSFARMFYDYGKLVTVDENLFINNPNITNFANCFRGCTSLIEIPEKIFSYHRNIVNLNYCFTSCSALSNFTLHIISSNVTMASSFVTKKTGTTRTISVPAGSTTETTFNGIASSLGLTIIGV